METPTPFSAREKDVLNLLLQGRSNKQIAFALSLSERTVEFHLSHIYTKLGVSSRTEVLAILADPGLRVTLGAANNPDRRESRIETPPAAAHNNGMIISVWRKRMPKYIYPVITGLVMLIALLVIIPGAPVQEPAEAAVNTPTHESANYPVVAGANTPEVTATASSPVSQTVSATSSSDQAVLLSETYPDGTILSQGESLTKTWTLQNNGTATWTTDYRFVLTEYGHPLTLDMGEPGVIPIPHSVAPGQSLTISIPLQAPAMDGTYHATYQLLNSAGELVLGSGGLIWFSLHVGAPDPQTSAAAGGISLWLGTIQRQPDYTTVQICATYPDTQDWNPDMGTYMEAGGQQASIESYQLENHRTAYTSVNRCFLLGFPMGTNQYGTDALTVTIPVFRVGAETHLEENCARAHQMLDSQYPELVFSCGTPGFWYSLQQFPSNLTSEQAGQLIMDAMEQAIYGPWILTE